MSTIQYDAPNETKWASLCYYNNGVGGGGGGFGGGGSIDLGVRQH